MQNNDVRYLIVGGAAVNLHGVPRMTADLDLLVDMSESNIGALVLALDEVGLKPAVPVDPLMLADPAQRERLGREKNLKALTFQPAGGGYREVDIVLEAPLGFEEMYADRLQTQAGGLTITIVSLPHLVEIKRSAGRKQDLADIESLEKVRSERGG
ncbi:MAG: DUF6036 family nucleotidyltransferase [Thermoleophilia bacterium]